MNSFLQGVLFLLKACCASLKNALYVAQIFYNIWFLSRNRKCCPSAKIKMCRRCSRDIVGHGQELSTCLALIRCLSPSLSVLPALAHVFVNLTQSMHSSEFCCFNALFKMRLCLFCLLLLISYACYCHTVNALLQILSLFIRIGRGWHIHMRANVFSLIGKCGLWIPTLFTGHFERNIGLKLVCKCLCARALVSVSFSLGNVTFLVWVLRLAVKSFVLTCFKSKRAFSDLVTVRLTVCQDGNSCQLPFAMAIYGLFVISCHLLPEVKGLGDTVGKTAEMLQRNESLSEVRHDAICVVFWLDCWPLLNLVFFDPDPLPRLRICLFPRTSPLWLGQIEMHWFIWRSPSWKMRWTPSSGDKKSSICRLR